MAKWISNQGLTVPFLFIVYLYLFLDNGCTKLQISVIFWYMGFGVVQQTVFMFTNGKEWEKFCNKKE